MANVSIGVILTSYKRPWTLQLQLDAIRKQTIPAREVVIWHNGGNLLMANLRKNESVVTCTKNWGVWPRFSFGLHLDVEFVAIFDDDTIPGTKWFENCLATMCTTGDAVLGTAGVRFTYGSRCCSEAIGWKRPSSEIAEVDIVGHAWFFPRYLLHEMADSPCLLSHPTAGEDYWLSVIAQKRGMKTYCPPHPPDDKEWWGSVKGWKFGQDANALYRQPNAVLHKQQAHDTYTSIGWKPMALGEFNVISNATAATAK